MTAQILDGRAIARSMQKEITFQVMQLEQQTGQKPGLAIVQVGADAASKQYARAIERGFGRVGMHVQRISLAADTAQEQLTDTLHRLNMGNEIHGIIVQLPLPAHIPQTVLVAIAPQKDVDGVHPLNAGLLMQGHPEALVPATPSGGMELLRRYNIPLQGQRAVVIGRSQIVGRPMALLLLHEHATVTICHSRTRDLADITRQADILAVATGQPQMITSEMVKPGATVIDFGINFIGDQMVGDVDTGPVTEVAGYITPVPGGTGPMTNVMLMESTLKAARRQMAL